MSEYIPFEIQVEILKRLPINSVIQFRSVCKTWKCLIDSPDFIVSYGVRHPQPHRLLLRYKDVVVDFQEKYFTFVDDYDHTFAQQDFAPALPDVINRLDHSSVLGSSHGLLCLYGYYQPPNDDYDDDDGSGYKCGTYMAVLWNPSIRQSVGIQVPHDDDWPNDIVVGFGVCPVTIDPTIIKISCVGHRKRNEMSGISIPWKVQVFTLSYGAWNILSTNLPRESVRLRGGEQVIIDRFIYWVAYDTIAHEDEIGEFQTTFLIISFDLTTREFCAIDLPDNLALGHQTLCISKLRDSLVVLEYTREAEVEEPVCSVWMMIMEQGVTTSFARLFTINLPDKSAQALLAFRKTGEPILVTQEQYERYAAVEIYEPCSQQIDNLGIYGEDGFFYVGSYMESLLLLDQLDGYIYSNSN